MINTPRFILYLKVSPYIFFLSAALLCVVIIVMWNTAEAQLTSKEPYTIPGEIKYKREMSIAVLPFEGKLNSERLYLKDMIKNYLEDRILSYKWIKISNSIIDFERKGYNSHGVRNKRYPRQIDPASLKSDKQDNSPVMVSNELDKNSFLLLELIEDDRLKRISKIDDTESDNSYIQSGVDVIVKGEVQQKKKAIKVNLKVYNNLHGEIFLIEKEGNLKEINQLLDNLLKEVVKTILVDYGYLDISARPIDAKIYVDGRYFGRGDKKIILETGGHEVIVLKDHISKKSLVILSKDESKSFSLSILNEKIVRNNSVKIITRPESARIYFDSTFIGLSPVEINDLHEGSYRVRVEMKGYISKYKTLKIGRSDDENFIFNLEKGDSTEFYFSRSGLYYSIFNYSLLTATISGFTAFYFHIRAGDEEAKQRVFEFSNPEAITEEENIQFNHLMKTTNQRIDRFNLYRNILYYIAGSLFINACIFYYFDIAQDDIPIALYFPEVKHSGEVFASNLNYKNLGLRFILRF